MGNAVTTIYSVNGDKNEITASDKNDLTSRNDAVLDKPEIQAPTQPVHQAAYLTTAMNLPEFTHALGDNGLMITEAGSSCFMTDEDEMSPEFLFNKFCFLRSENLAYGSQAGSLLGYYPMTPYQHTMYLREQNRPAVGKTTTEWMALMYRRFRGAMQLRFKIIGPGFIAGRLQCSLLYQNFSDDTNDFPTAQQASQLPTFYFDYDANCREFTIEVPFVMPRQWLINANTFTGFRNFFKERYMAGTVLLYNSTTTVSGGTDYNTPPIVQVYMAAPDLQLEDANPPGGYRDPNIQSPGTTNVGTLPAVLNSFVADVDDDDSVVVLPNVREPATRDSGVRRMRKQSKTLSYGTTVNTKTDVRQGRVSTYKPENTEVGAFNLSDLTTKWTLLDVRDISTTTAPGLLASYSVPRDLKINLTEYAVERAIMYRTDVVIRIAPKATMWQGGLAIAAFIPLAETATSVRTLDFSYLTSLPHAMVDFSSTQAVEFVIPYRTFREYFVNNGNPQEETQGQLVIWLENAQFPTTGSGFIQLEILYAWENYVPVAPKFGGSVVTMRKQSKLVDQYHKPATGGVDNAEILEHSSDANIRTNHTPAVHSQQETSVEGTHVTNPDASHTNEIVEATTDGVTLTNTEASPEVLRVFTYTPRILNIRTPRHPRELCKRPTAFRHFSIQATADQYYCIPLWQADFNPLTQINNGVINQMVGAYAGYTGDFIITVVADGVDSIDVLTVPNPGISGADLDNMFAYSFASRVGITLDGSGDPLLTGANVPTEAQDRRSGQTYRIPYRALYRFIKTDQRSEEATGQLLVPVIYLHTPTSAQATVRVYLSISDGARFGLWRGTPDWSFAPLVRDGTNYIWPDAGIADGIP